MFYLILAAILFAPLLALLLFILSLIGYLRAKRKNKITPDTVPAEEMHALLVTLILSLILAVGLAIPMVSVVSYFIQSSLGLIYM